MGFSTYFYKNADQPTSQAYNLTLVQFGLGFFSTIGSWVLMSYMGRRTLYLGGLAILCVLLVGIGGVGFAPANDLITQTKRNLDFAISGADAYVANLLRRASWSGVGISQCPRFLGSRFFASGVYPHIRLHSRTGVLCDRGGE